MAHPMIRSGYHSSWSPSLRTVLTFALPSASGTQRFMTTHLSRQLYLMQRVCGAMSTVPRGVPARQLRLEVSDSEQLTLIQLLSAVWAVPFTLGRWVIILKAGAEPVCSTFALQISMLSPSCN